MGATSIQTQYMSPNFRGVRRKGRKGARSIDSGQLSKRRYVRVKCCCSTLRHRCMGLVPKFEIWKGARAVYDVVGIQGLPYDRFVLEPGRQEVVHR